jgi:hypothetical protein
MAPLQGQGVILHGFVELERALARIDGPGNFGLDYELNRRLRNVGERVGHAAETFVTHGTGRHGDPDQPRLEDSVGVSVTKRRASVFSRAIHGGAQQYGAGPKAGWPNRGPHIRADRASKWMSKGVASQQEYTAEELDGFLDWLVTEFHRG